MRTPPLFPLVALAAIVAVPVAAAGVSALDTGDRGITAAVSTPEDNPDRIGADDDPTSSPSDDPTSASPDDPATPTSNPTSSPSAEATGTPADRPATEQGTHDVATADGQLVGRVTVRRDGATLTLVDADLVDARWSMEVEQASGLEVEVVFERGAQRVDFEAEIEDGRIRTRVRDRSAGTEVFDGAPPATSSPDDNSGPGNADDDDDNSGPGNADDGTDDDADDNSGPGNTDDDDDDADDNSGPGNADDDDDDADDNSGPGNADDDDDDSERVRSEE